jgi:IS30 family transposase
MQHHENPIIVENGVVSKRYKHMSIEERTDIWRRWKEGENCSDIARATGRTVTAAHSVIHARGGIAPLPRQRSALTLTLLEREEISRGLCMGWSLRRIARALGRAPSTISREVTRHGGAMRYRALTADRRAWRRARRPKKCRLATHEPLRQIVMHKLLLDWSPQQISGWLELHYGDDETMQVSHETIYRSLFIQARGVLRGELAKHLRSGRTLRRARKAGSRPNRQGQILDAVSIRERPAQAQDRAVPGHWEGDLLCGSKQTQIATLVERRSRFLILVKVPSKHTSTVVRALSKQVRKLPALLRGSLTWDRGFELAHHKEFTMSTDMRVYFCDPASPWQRGSNENTNGLLRQYFPKGTDLSGYSQAQLNEIAVRLNQRPRETLGFSTPAAKLAETVASTG